MVTRNVIWHPDTCSCVVQYSWDDTLPLNTQTFPISNTIKTCSAHAQLNTTNQTNFMTVIREENTRKNKALQHILDNGPAVLSDLGPDGVSKVLKAGLVFNFSVSGTPPSRVFTISFSPQPLTAAQITAGQTLLDNKFGQGKVVLQ